MLNTGGKLSGLEDFQEIWIVIKPRDGPQTMQSTEQGFCWVICLSWFYSQQNHSVIPSRVDLQ